MNIPCMQGCKLCSAHCLLQVLILGFGFAANIADKHTQASEQQRISGRLGHRCEQVGVVKIVVIYSSALMKLWVLRLSRWA
nr:hypothetical protein [Methylobacillus flagellatus]